MKLCSRNYSQIELENFLDELKKKTKIKKKYFRCLRVQMNQDETQIKNMIDSDLGTFMLSESKLLAY